MELTNLIRFGTVFLIIAATMSVNLDDNLLARVGFGGHATALLTAGICTFIIFSRNVYYITIAVILSLVANMPGDFGLNFGFDRDLYAGVLLAMLLQPFLHRAFEG
ncbi:MAG: hypothetical protein AAF525_16730 [Pseudomonadota bacterium]